MEEASKEREAPINMQIFLIVHSARWDKLVIKEGNKDSNFKRREMTQVDD